MGPCDRRIVILNVPKFVVGNIVAREEDDRRIQVHSSENFKQRPSPFGCVILRNNQRESNCAEERNSFS